MEGSCASTNSNPKYLLEQLIIARKEINNLRQQIKSLRHIHEKDVTSIKNLLEAHMNTSSYSEEPIPFYPGSFSKKVNEPSASDSSYDSLTFCPIGYISTWFPNKKGTPRQPTVCEKIPGKLTLSKNILTNPNHALQGLEEFSHMWILFHFHKNEQGHIRAKVAPPRLNGIRTGVFSTRSPHRPSPIGLSLVKIIKIEENVIYFQGVDMVDNTPVLDIKPYIPVYDNPSYVEKILQPILLEELDENNSSTLIEPSLKYLNIYTKNASVEDFSENLQTINKTLCNSREDNMANYQSHINTPSTSSSIAPSQLDVSRDEELAFRLQAEEFKSELSYENNYSYNQNPNIENHFESSVINTNTSSNQTSDLEISINDDPNLRNSRLLDGADGPNPVCETDLDLINRRALNLRIDDSSSSSPIRMGVREAPDGEEGLDLPQFQNTPTSINLSNDCINSASNQAESIIDEPVRVPDWILQPKTSPLSVVFNERALIQLHEILENRADEKKCAVENVLKEDPRSVYLRQKYGNQFYTFLIHDLHITCKFDDDKKIVTVFQIRHAGRMCDCGQPEWQCSGHSPLPTYKLD